MGVLVQVNYVLFLHDRQEFWGGLGDVEDDLGTLVRDYTNDKVSVGVQSESGRIEELENMLSDSVEQWSDARDIVGDLVKNIRDDLQTVVLIHELRKIFDLNANGELE